MTATPTLSQCPRCNGFTLVAPLAGLHVAVDVTPADALAFGVAVAGGVGLWRLVAGPDGTPGRLKAYSASLPPQWGVGGSQTGSERVHVEHSCGALAKDQRPVKLAGADTGPQEASATSGSARGGSHPLAALAGATEARERPSRALTASRHRSESPVRCHDCNRLVDQRVPFIGIHHGRWVWAVHEECP